MYKTFFFGITILIVSLGKLYAQLPTFSFYDLEGNVFTQSQLDPDKSTFIMFYDPYCDHFHTQASFIAEAADKFKDKQLVFVTIEPENEPIKNFYTTHFEGRGLDVYMLQDLDFQFETYFGYTDDVINIYLYKPGERKLKYFGEETEAESLLKYL